MLHLPPEAHHEHAAGEHVDAVTASLRDLTGPQQALLAGKGEQLALAAANSTPDEFRRQVAKIARQLCADDGMARLERFGLLIVAFLVFSHVIDPLLAPVTIGTHWLFQTLFF